MSDCFKNRIKMELVFKGFINFHSFNENEEALFINGYDEPLAKVLAEEIYNKNVVVDYWISDFERADEEVKKCLHYSLGGCAISIYKNNWISNSGYEEYLGTDEKIKIGEDNLLDILGNISGKYIYLEIKVII